MQYRTFEKINEKTSLLGMGCMRLPVDSNDTVKEEEAIRIIRDAIDGGVNYVDTAFMYHNGQSEKILGKALKDGYREKVLLAVKMPIWFAKDEDGMRTIFEKQMTRLDTDCIDMYPDPQRGSRCMETRAETESSPLPGRAESCRQDPSYRILIPRFLRLLPGGA